MFLRLWCLAALMASATASSCGDSSIPFSLEVLSDGRPVLGCARPSCFGWLPTGQPALSIPSAFYNINGRTDGFLRRDRQQISPFAQIDARHYTPQIAVCEGPFFSSSCPGVTQWVGGIAPLSNISSNPLVLQCCAYDSLRLSEDRGVAVVGGGQIFNGGEVSSASGQQYGFDYIANIAKVIQADKSVAYEVSVRRMPCAPFPEEAGVGKQGNAVKDAVAFQAPTVNGGAAQALQGLGEQALFGGQVQPPPPGPPTGVDTVGVQEIIVRQEGIQAPPGSFQQQPPPVFQQQPFFPQAQQPFAYQQQAPAYNYPSYGGGGGQQYFEFCFSADMEVQLSNGQSKRMDQLQRGNMVLSMEDRKMMYSPVNFWLHRVPSRQADFHVFQMENGKSIKITSHHYIYKGDCSFSGRRVPMADVSEQMVFAEDVVVGDCLYTASIDNQYLEESRVVNSSVVSETGIFAPMTENGRIVVNGVYASCHNIVPSHSLQFSFFSLVEDLKEWYGYAIGGFSGETNDVEMSGLPTVVSLLEFVVPKNVLRF